MACLYGFDCCNVVNSEHNRNLQAYYVLVW